MEKHQKEIEKISQEHENSVKEAEVKLSQKHKQILAVQEDQSKEYKRIIQQQEDGKKMHERDIKALGSEQANEINIENQKFEKIVKSIQDDIDRS